MLSLQNCLQPRETKEPERHNTAKRLDRFLILESLLDEVNHMREWVSLRGDFDHNLVILEIAPTQENPSPFKMNPEWINDESFIIKVKKYGNLIMET
jgi:hypothetical protein